MRRPEGVTIIALWYFVLTLFCLFGLGGVSIGIIGVWSENNAQGILMGTMSLMLAVLAIVVTGTAFALTGWGLWNMKSWSRGSAIILAALQLIVVPIGTISGTLILVYLNRNKAAKAAFGILETASGPGTKGLRP